MKVKSSQFKVKIEKLFRGLNEVEQKTCLSIRPRISEENYIHILPGAGCYSSIGIGNICEVKEAITHHKVIV